MKLKKQNMLVPNMGMVLIGDRRKTLKKKATKLDAIMQKERFIIMRKRFKIKKHSCSLCKPNKTGHAHRWNNRDLYALKDFEKEKRRLIKI